MSAFVAWAATVAAGVVCLACTGLAVCGNLLITASAAAIWAATSFSSASCRDSIRTFRNTSSKD
ncbi:MAG: hypothetical protein K8S55_00375 [Phycisphaerae bacterium]|nr:hypothetical protein [Phycisphaerae bacterium]